MSDQREMMIRAAEAMREAAARAIIENIEATRRNGYSEAADAKELAYRRVFSLDAVKLVDTIAEIAANGSEQAAFDAAAKQALFNVQRRDNGELFHPISSRVFQVWQAAVRWQKQQEK